MYTKIIKVPNICSIICLPKAGENVCISAGGLVKTIEPF